MKILNHTALAVLICETMTASKAVNSEILTGKLQTLLPDLDLQASPLIELLVKKDLGLSPNSWRHRLEAGGWTK